MAAQWERRRVNKQLSGHSELARRAETWLRNGCIVPGHNGHPRKIRCAVVMREMMSTGWETPDAIGFAYGGRVTVLVEVKVSRSDFFADSKKVFRSRPELGMGMFRYFLTPPGLVSINELPERWGLLTLHGRSVRVARVAAEFGQRHTTHEMAMLVSLARRLQRGD
jgi:hypothetical protein